MDPLPLHHHNETATHRRRLHGDLAKIGEESSLSDSFANPGKGKPTVCSSHGNPLHRQEEAKWPVELGK